MWVTSGTLRPVYDCYVIGSGPAGITLALELAKANKKVLLFESGTATDARAHMPNAINQGHLPDGCGIDIPYAHSVAPQRSGQAGVSR